MTMYIIIVYKYGVLRLFFYDIHVCVAATYLIDNKQLVFQKCLTAWLRELIKIFISEIVKNIVCYVVPNYNILKAMILRKH